jgi:hypothetical protein
MDEQARSKLVTLLRSRKGLSGVGVIYLEQSGGKVFCRSDAEGIYVLLYQAATGDERLPPEALRQKINSCLAATGFGVDSLKPVGVVGDDVGCFIGAVGGTSAGQMSLSQAVKEMQEVNMSFNMQYLMLQQKMQDESRRFTLLSNIMKTKHDTAKNSISNVR